MKLSISKPLLFVMALLIAFMPELAFAQDVSFPFTPSEGDKSREWFIKGLFGGLDGGGADPLANIIGIFNSAVLLIGGILLFYTLVGGTIRTAGEGKVLGKWDSIWLPIRTVLGVAAILPAGPSGYALIQYVVIWLALQGIGIADLMSGKFVETVLTNNSGTQYSFEVGNIKPEITEIVRQMVFNSACVATFDASIDANDIDTKNVFNIKPRTGRAMEYNVPPPPAELLPEHQRYRFGCGSVVFQPALSVHSDASQLQLIDTAVLAELRQSMWETNDVYKNAAMAASASVGAQIAQGSRNEVDDISMSEGVEKAIDDISTVWADAVVEKAKEQSQDIINQKTVDRIKSDGWIMLGSLYMQIALSQQTLSEAMSVLPVASTPDSIIEGSRKEVEGEANLLTRVVGAVVRWGKEEQVRLGDSPKHIMYAVRVTNAGAESNDASSSSPKGMIAKVMRGVTRVFAGIDVGGSTDKNPVILASEIGNRLITSTIIAIGIAAIAAGFAGVKATIGTNIVLVLVSIFSPMMVALLGVGMTLSYYVPMIPYILWLGAVFGWVILIVEAVIAAPIWAVTHLAPDGDGVVGRGGQGYMLVLSLTLRPALMVFGFAAAVAVMDPMGKFLNETFMGAFFGSVSPGFFGVLKILAGSIIYATILLMIINRVFSLIHQVPDGILRWIGGGDNIIGREAEQASSGAGKAIMASTAAATAIGSVQGGAQQIAQGARQRSIEKSQRKSAAAGTAAQQAGNEGDKAARGLESARRSADSLDPGSDGFEAQASGTQKEADASALSSVSSIASSAKATLAADAAADGNTENRPSAADVQAARDIIGSIESSGADKDTGAARQWLSDSAPSEDKPGAYEGSKFNAQIGAAAGGVQGVDNTLGEARTAHKNIKAEEARSAAEQEQQEAAANEKATDERAVSDVGNIHANATDVIERAGTAIPGDPNAPTESESIDAQNIKNDIESSGAMNSPENAKNWLSNAQDKFGGSSMGQEVSLAASRAANSGGGGNPPGGGGNPPGGGGNPPGGGGNPPGGGGNPPGGGGNPPGGGGGRSGGGVNG